MATETTTEPVQETERIVGIDLLRGVAVLGILIVNMQYMGIAESVVSSGSVAIRGATGFEWAADAFIRIFAEMKFITIFSILFGAGLGLMWRRAEQRDDDGFTGRYARRLAALLLIGLAHGLLIWFGDILTAYAVIGFLALCSRRIAPPSAFYLAGVLLLLTYALWMLLVVLGPFLDDTSVGPTADDVARILGSGDFAAMLGLRSGFFVFALTFVLTMFGPRIFATFLIGLGLVRSGVLAEPAAHRPRFRRWAFGLLPLGLGLEILGFMLGGTIGGVAGEVAAASGLYFGSLALAFGYIGLVMLWSLGDRAKGLQSRLAAVGRMALTNYLMHSVITAIFFNYLGAFDRFGKAAGLGFTGLIFAFQLWWSPWWLARFRFGPVEWAWRSVTYRKRQPFRLAMP